MKERSVKIAVASLAYLPMLAFAFFRASGVYAGEIVATALTIFYFPVVALLNTIEIYHLEHGNVLLLSLLLMFLWSSLIAWFLWRIVGMFQGEDEPDDQQGKFDWVGFQVRFVVGFVIGFLLGWRFVRNSTSMTTVTIACLVTGCFGGALYGVSRPPNFWSRP